MYWMIGLVTLFSKKYLFDLKILFIKSNMSIEYIFTEWLDIFNFKRPSVKHNKRVPHVNQNF